MARKICVNTTSVIKALRQNKEQHIFDYEKAKIFYKEEGLRQVAEIAEKLKNGETGLYLHLTEPINREEWYDDKIKMFEMEISATVELEQYEFESLILDKDSDIKEAKFANSFYSHVR